MAAPYYMAPAGPMGPTPQMMAQSQFGAQMPGPYMQPFQNANQPGLPSRPGQPPMNPMAMQAMWNQQQQANYMLSNPMQQQLALQQRPMWLQNIQSPFIPNPFMQAFAMPPQQQPAPETAAPAAPTATAIETATGPKLQMSMSTINSTPVKLNTGDTEFSFSMTQPKPKTPPAPLQEQMSQSLIPAQNHQMVPGMGYTNDPYLLTQGQRSSMEDYERRERKRRGRSRGRRRSYDDSESDEMEDDDGDYYRTSRRGQFDSRERRVPRGPPPPPPPPQQTYYDDEEAVYSSPRRAREESMGYVRRYRDAMEGNGMKPVGVPGPVPWGRWLAMVPSLRRRPLPGMGMPAPPGMMRPRGPPEWGPEGDRQDDWTPENIQRSYENGTADDYRGEENDERPDTAVNVRLRFV